MRLFCALLLFSLIVAGSCTNANVEEDFPGEPCVNTTATYSGDVQPIIKSNCYRCHDTDTRFGGVFLEGYANVAAYANSGSLMNVIRGTNGYPTMPNDNASMLKCDIRSIELWLQDGAENN